MPQVVRFGRQAKRDQERIDMWIERGYGALPRNPLEQYRARDPNDSRPNPLARRGTRMIEAGVGIDAGARSVADAERLASLGAGGIALTVLPMEERVDASFRPVTEGGPNDSSL